MDITPKIESTIIQITINANEVLKGWVIYYGSLMRQAEKGELDEFKVIKACKRVLEDLGEIEC